MFREREAGLLQVGGHKQTRSTAHRSRGFSPIQRAIGIHSLSSKLATWNSAYNAAYVANEMTA